MQQFKVYFTSRPEDIREALKLLSDLGGFDIGAVEDARRLVYPKRFVLDYRHNDHGLGYVATAEIRVDYGYGSPQFLKQLTRLFKRMPGVAFCLQHPEEIRLQQGKPAFNHWGIYRARVAAVINGDAYQVYDEDDTGLSTLWRRRPDEPHGHPIGKVPPDITEEGLAQLISA